MNLTKKKKNGLRVNGNQNMNESDKPIFLRKIKEVAYAVDRKIKIEQVDSYFNHLKSYPINIVCKALDRALMGRDPNEPYLSRAIITIPEVLTKIRDLMNEEYKGSNPKCDKCTQDRWIILPQAKGQPKVRRCECFSTINKSKPGEVSEEDMEPL